MIQYNNKLFFCRTICLCSHYRWLWALWLCWWLVWDRNEDTVVSSCLLNADSAAFSNMNSSCTLIERKLPLALSFFKPFPPWFKVKTMSWIKGKRQGVPKWLMPEEKRVNCYWQFCWRWLGSTAKLLWSEGAIGEVWRHVIPWKTMLE